jgi:hypothetical protein
LLPFLLLAPTSSWLLLPSLPFSWLLACLRSSWLPEPSYPLPVQRLLER